MPMRPEKKRVYQAWYLMHRRCEDPSNPSWKNYGGRGIKVCSRWKSFKNFHEDMGDCPPSYQLDRIDNDGDYAPGNCRWATATEQARNRRSNHLLNHNGETLTISEWAERVGLDKTVIWQRVSVWGWPVEAALSSQTRCHLITFRGKTQRITEWARETGIPQYTLSRRLNNYGWDVARALTTPIS